MGSNFSFTKKKPEQQLSELNLVLQHKDSFDPDTIEQVQRLRANTQQLIELALSPTEQNPLKKAEKEQLLQEQQRTLDLIRQNKKTEAQWDRYVLEMQRESNLHQNQFQGESKSNEANQPNPPVHVPLVPKIQVACQNVQRPTPTAITARNMAQYSIYANSGLLVRIVDNIGLGCCTATLLHDGQTLVTAGHCVGKKVNPHTFKVAGGADALRWCPMYSKLSKEGLSQSDLMLCPFVTRMYILKGWHEHGGLLIGHNRQGMQYDVGVLKLDKNIEEYQHDLYGKYGIKIGGLPFNYIQDLDLFQMTDSPHQTVSIHGAEISNQRDLDYILHSQPLFRREASYNAKLTVAGYPTDSNNQLWMYTWHLYYDNLEDPDPDGANPYPMCMYALCQNTNNFGRARITFPLKTNHGASGSSLIANGNIIGVLSSGSTTEGQVRTTFRIFDIPIARFIAAVSKNFDAIVTYNTNAPDDYKVVGFEFHEPIPGQGFMGIEQLFIPSSAQEMDMDSLYYNDYYDAIYDSIDTMDGRYPPQYLMLSPINPNVNSFSSLSDSYGLIAVELMVLIFLMVLCCLFIALCVVFSYWFFKKAKQTQNQERMHLECASDIV
eukprot:249083_1